MTFARPLCLLVLFCASSLQAAPGFPLLILVPEMYPTLEQAVINAATGDFISLASGEHIVRNDALIDKNRLTILGRTGRAADVRIRAGTGGDLSAMVRVVQREGFLLRDVTLTGTRTLTTGLLVQDSTGAEIRNCHFTNHRSFASASVFIESDARVEDCTFESCLAVTNGGAMGLRVSSDPARRHTVAGCRFLVNGSGFNGGSIAAFAPILTASGEATSGILEVTGCEFIENGVGSGGLFNAGALGEGHGGALYLASTEPGMALSAKIRHCTFTLCSASEGAAISLDRSLGLFDLLLEECCFAGNVADASTGGAVAAYVTARDDYTYGSESVLEVTGCVFEDNSAEVMGGAFSITQSQIPTGYRLEGCEFRGNRANTGGAVALGSTDRLFSFTGGMDNELPLDLVGDIRFCSFLLNSATTAGAGGNGGALYLLRTLSEIAGNRFGGNRADNSGGAIFASRDFSLIRDNFIGTAPIHSFGGNSAGAFGGAVAAFLASPPGTFSNKGAFIEAEGLALVNNLIAGNTSEEGGGGVSLSLYSSYPGGGLVAGNYLLNNRAEEGPGEAFYLNQGIERDVYLLNNTLVLEATPAGALKGPALAGDSLVYLEEDINAYLVNNLLVGSGTGGSVGVFERDLGFPTVWNNCFFNLATPYVMSGTVPLDATTLNDPLTHAGNFLADPRLRPGPDPVYGMFDPHLLGSSPLIHAGTEIPLLSDQQRLFIRRDIDSHYQVKSDGRILGAAVDIGADEWNLRDLDCDLVPGDRCDALDLIAILEDRAGVKAYDTDFTRDGVEDYADVFGFGAEWYGGM